MKTSDFSNLIYKIIGTPERWHDDYIDIMNEILDETDTHEDSESFSKFAFPELAIGEQLLSRISGSTGALKAFYTLLDKNRFQMIILDESLTAIFHNRSADDLFDYLCTSDQSLSANSNEKSKKLKPALLEKLKLAIKKNEQNMQQAPDAGEHLTTIDHKGLDGEQLYLRSIRRQSEAAGVEYFYIIMMLDKAHSQSALNPELVAQYKLTEKEQMVLSQLIHGYSIKTISEKAFITENTVKTHIKALFRKTGTNSQADIVRMVLTHESQVLDSYFDTSPSRVDADTTKNLDLSVTLKSGQVIVYREYGPKNGDPIIMFHNGFGCRTSIPLDHMQTCKRLNKRIIIPDRPGRGKSPFINGHPKKWHTQLSEFATALNLKSFDIIGHVLGCPLALEHAAQADKRLNRIILASPVFVNTKDDAQYLQGIFVPTVRLIKLSKRFAREIYELWLKSIMLNLGTHYRVMVDKSLGDKEQNLSGDKEQFLDSLVDSFREGISQSLEGITHEMVYCVSPMKLNLSKIKNPVEIWYGTQDGRISQAGAEHLATQLPNATLHIESGYSEHIYYALFDKIMSTSYDAPKTR